MRRHVITFSMYFCMVGLQRLDDIPFIFTFWNQFTLVIQIDNMLLLFVNFPTQLLFDYWRETPLSWLKRPFNTSSLQHLSLSSAKINKQTLQCVFSICVSCMHCIYCYLNSKLQPCVTKWGTMSGIFILNIPQDIKE